MPRGFRHILSRLMRPEPKGAGTIIPFSVAALRSFWNGDPAAPAGFARLPAAFEPDASWLERGWLDRKIDLLVDE